MNKFYVSALTGICAIALAACSTDATEVNGYTGTSTTVDATSLTMEYGTIQEVAFADLGIADIELEWNASDEVEVLLADGASSSASSAVSVDGDVVTISAGGTYRLSGTLTEGQVVVDADGQDVRLILDGVDISAVGSAALWVTDAENVIVWLADGSDNTLSDANGASDDEDAPNAALWSSADTWIAGSGSLTVDAERYDGITSKDSLVILSGSLSITAADDGIRGKDHLVIEGGDITINSAGDGLRSDNETVTDDPAAAVGVIWIAGGTLDITSGSDAMDAANQLTVAGGDITVSAEDDGLHSDGFLRIVDGVVNVTDSYEGLESAVMYIDGGEITVRASDDGINISGGAATATSTTAVGADVLPGDLPAGDLPVGDLPPGDFAVGDAALGDAPVGGPPAGGMPPGGQTGDRPERPGGVVADDALGGAVDTVTDAGGRGPMFDVSFGEAGVLSVQDGTALATHGPAEGGSAENFLDISGGVIEVTSEGDGIDVNGTWYMTGGTVVVNGPSINSEGALDADNGLFVTGGTIAASGMPGMAVSPEAGTAQGSLNVAFSELLPVGTVIVLSDGSGEVVAVFETSKASQSLVFTSPDLTVGTDYTVSLGEVTAGELVGGLWVGGDATILEQLGTVVAV